MTQQKRGAITSGQLGPKWQGLGRLPNRHDFRVLAVGQNTKNLRVSIHSHCLPFDETAYIGVNAGLQG